MTIEPNTAITAAIAKSTGRRYCTTCQRDANAETGTWTVTNGVRKWRCMSCAQKRSPQWGKKEGGDVA